MNSFCDKFKVGIKNLSIGLKKKFLPALLKRDGFFCFYCGCELKIDSFVYEHLNNDRRDNRIENIVLACISCNNKKPNNHAMQVKADKKLESNKHNFMSERKIPEKNQTNETSTEIEINVSNFEIVKQYITEIVNTDGFILLKEAINSTAYLCKNKTGHGSPQSVRNYISMLVSEVGPLNVIQDKNKKKIIVKRTDELNQNNAKIDSFCDNLGMKK